MKFKYLLLIILIFPVFIWAQDYQIIYDDFPSCNGETSTNNLLETGYITGNVIGLSSDGTYQLQSGLIFIYEHLITDIDENNNTPNISYQLYNNYPNPFSYSTSVMYCIPRSTKVKILIYNIKGQLVETLVDSDKLAGYHTVEWDAKDMSSGIYFYKLTTKDKTFIKKIILMR
ncbi:MAG: T9SS type A sorting domain-containing protein [Candidatus Cloacimonetes bacterium]|nr:T9SS type A sorting domain-containing protein [Candidatus Cloacimonadota bacterium]